MVTVASLEKGKTEKVMENSWKSRDGMNRGKMVQAQFPDGSKGSIPGSPVSFQKVDPTAVIIQRV